MRRCILVNKFNRTGGAGTDQQQLGAAHVRRRPAVHSGQGADGPESAGGEGSGGGEDLRGDSPSRAQVHRGSGTERNEGLVLLAKNY